MRRSLTKLEGGVAVLNKPALADFLRTVPGNSRVVRVRDQGSRPAGNAKQYMEVRPWEFSGCLSGFLTIST